MPNPNPLTRAKKKQALECFQQNRIAEAKALYARICQTDRRDTEAWNMLGAIHGMLGEFSESEKCCRQVIALYPGAVGTYNNLGNALKFQGKLAEAETAYLKALNLQPDYAEALNNLGNLLKDKGEFDDAERCFQKALRFAPDYAEASNNFGNLLRERGRAEEAAACYIKALQSNPGYVDAFYNLGMLLQQQGKTDEAAACYRQATHFKPDHVEALLNLGSLLQEKGQHAEAEAAYRKVLKLKPDSVTARYLLSAFGTEEVPAQSPDEYVRQLFDFYANTFDRHLVNDLAYHTPEKLFDAVVRTAGKRGGGDGDAALDVLDLGCGTGLCGALFRGMARRLVGVDLSPKMLDKARERGVYDELLLGDVIAAMAAPAVAYDVIVSADVFIYIGDLSAIFEASRTALKPGGLFAFSIETAADGGADYVLRGSGRYAQSLGYIRRLAAESGLTELSAEPVVLRQEAGKPVEGSIFVYGRG